MSAIVAHNGANIEAGVVQNASKLPQLEGLRGIAAVMVVAWHFLWAFAPWELGTVAGWPSHGLIGNPVTAAIDGPAAVALFFVLSGFVVPLRFFHSGRSRTVFRAAAKRWPRLAGLSVLAALFAYAMFQFDLFHYRQAGALTGSDWLATYGGGAPGGRFAPSFTGALREGLIGAFVNKSDNYDPVLWTMRHELLGSLLSLAVAVALRRGPMKPGGIFVIAATALATALDPWLFPFVVGTGLAFIVCTRQVRLGGPAAAACMVIGVFLFGYLQPTGAYSGLPVIQDTAGYRYDRIMLHTVSGLLIILGLVGNDNAGRALAARPLLLLGRISFPVYLFHFPLLCSLGCGLFILFQQRISYVASIALVACIYASVVLLTSVLMVRIDDVWGAWVDRLANLVLTQIARNF